VSARAAFVRLPLQPLAYYRALLGIDRIFAKPPGNITVYHRLPASYYTCLLQLADPSALRELGDEVTQRPASCFTDLLGGVEGAEEGAEDAGQFWLAALEDDVGELYTPPGANLNPADIVGRGPDMVRHPMKYPLPDGRGEFTVSFDRCTHASGRQRAFVNCPWHPDEACRRYVFVHNFASARQAAAWLTAWALFEPRPGTKAEHYAVEPREEAIAAIMAAVR
jgi:hypothetical protein